MVGKIRRVMYKTEYQVHALFYPRYPNAFLANIWRQIYRPVDNAVVRPNRNE